MFANILAAYGLSSELYEVSRFGDGLINRTWKVTGPVQQYILQQVNQQVFTAPQDIAYNLDLLNKYFSKTAPDYLWVAPSLALNGQSFIQTAENDFFRLFPFVENSHSISTVTHAAQAYEAATQFGKFTRLLNHFDAGILKYTLTDFHNLSLRFSQLTDACKTASRERMELAAEALEDIYGHNHIIHTYNKLVDENLLPLRVIHHDTKISNVLFDEAGRGLCVIDLDTVMPGYFISDVGDMLRTYLSPANEEETDLDKVVVREEFLLAVYNGYMQQMAEVLTETEKKYFLYAGEFIIYMQAIRFLTDFLNNDIYYHSTYLLHNLVRAKNQLKLLHEYIQAQQVLTRLIARTLTTQY